MRTDLAIEEIKHWISMNAAQELSGAQWWEEKGEDEITVSTVQITTPEGARRLHRPQGRYTTLECPYLRDNCLDIHERIINALTKIWEDFLQPSVSGGLTLVVGLGNRFVSADALGPQVVDQLLVTRHLPEEAIPEEFRHTLAQVAALSPGVMGQTGVETSEMVKALVKQLHAERVIAVDALAAGSLQRLVTTIQICDTGIRPGAGMGNHRRELSYQTLGVPVLAVGVPTVVDIASLSEQPEGEAFYATPKDMDEVMRRLSRMIASSLNRALHHLSPGQLKAYLY